MERKCPTREWLKLYSQKVQNHNGPSGTKKTEYVKRPGAGANQKAQRVLWPNEGQGRKPISADR
ncbi:hypothetical protein KI387_018850, partial [Taxus chinensis]